MTVKRVAEAVSPVKMSGLRVCLAAVVMAFIFQPGVAAAIIPKTECGLDPMSEPPVPPEHYASTPGGVDMRSGAFNYSNIDLTIGGPDGGISLERTVQAEDTSLGVSQHFGQLFSHNWAIKIIENRIPVCEANVPGEYDYQMQISYGGLSTTFQSLYTRTNFRQISYDKYATLTFSGGIYTFTAYDGTTVRFRTLPAISGTQECATLGRCAYASSVTKPDGTQYTFEYDGTGFKHLRSVTSSRGYALLMEYGANYVTKACVLNVTATSKPSNNVCPTGVPTATYAYSADDLLSATDGTGGVHQQTYTALGSGGRKVAFTKPGAATPWTTIWIGTGMFTFPVGRQDFADGSFNTFTWNSVGIPAQDAGGSYTNNLNQTVTVSYGALPSSIVGDVNYYVTPGPVSITDKLGRQTVGDYCTMANNVCTIGPLKSWTYPEGNKKTFVMDNSRRPIQTTLVPKAGSGQASIVTSLGYGGAGCGGLACLQKPTSVTDARGAVTDFAYDATHGGVLSEMGPAPVAGAARPLKLTTWVQRYAWIKNSSGVLVQAATPVWVKSTETKCQTAAGSSTAACDTGASQTVTTYEYGATGTGEALLVKGVAVASGGTTLRTCYQYDSYARKIAETKPNANLGVCP